MPPARATDVTHLGPTWGLPDELAHTLVLLLGLQPYSNAIAADADLAASLARRLLRALQQAAAADSKAADGWHQVGLLAEALADPALIPALDRCLEGSGFAGAERALQAGTQLLAAAPARLPGGPATAPGAAHALGARAPALLSGSSACRSTDGCWGRRSHARRCAGG